MSEGPGSHNLSFIASAGGTVDPDFSESLGPGVAAKHLGPSWSGSSGLWVFLAGSDTLAIHKDSEFVWSISAMTERAWVSGLVPLGTLGPFAPLLVLAAPVLPLGPFPPGFTGSKPCSFHLLLASVTPNQTFGPFPFQVPSGGQSGIPWSGVHGLNCNLLVP